MSRFPECHPLRRSLCATLGVLALGFAPAALPAQTLGPDPYQPFNSLYKPFVYPNAPPMGGIPNMGRLDYLGSAPSPSRSFAGYLESVGAGTPNPFGRPRGNVSRFTPYYRSYRQFDSEFQRQVGSSTPDEFYRDQDERHRRYIEALRERDPKKREALLKQLEADNRAAIRASNDPSRFRTYRESRQGAEGADPKAKRGTAPAAGRNATTPLTPDEIDALPDPGPLPPDPNQPERRSRTASPPLELRSLRRSGTLGSNPSDVLERSRSTDPKRIRQSLDLLTEEPEAEPGMSPSRPGIPDLPDAEPSAPPTGDLPENLPDKP